MAKHVAESQPLAHLFTKSVGELERKCGQTVVPHQRKRSAEQEVQDRRRASWRAAVGKLVK